MRHISIGVSDQQHAKLKALAADKGLSIGGFILAKTLGDNAPCEAVAELEALLDERIARTKSTGVSRRTVGDIFRRTREDARRCSRD